MEARDWCDFFLLFTSISYERKHVSDLCTLVFCFRGHTFVVYLRTTKVHNNSVFKELTLHFLLQKSHLWNSTMPSDFQSQIPPMPSEFHNREPPLPFGNPKSRPWYGMDIFWNRPLCLKCSNVILICMMKCKQTVSHQNKVEKNSNQNSNQLL